MAPAPGRPVPRVRLPHQEQPACLHRAVLLVPRDPRGRDRLEEVPRRARRQWVGTADFTRVFHDPEFTAAWRNTFTFTLLALLIGFAVPFVMALVLNELRHAKAFFRVVVYLPVMIPP